MRKGNNMNPDGVFQETISAYNTIDYKDKIQQLEKERDKLQIENVALKEQIGELANYIMSNFKEHIKYEGACLTAIEIMKSLKQQLSEKDCTIKGLEKLLSAAVSQKTLNRQEVERIFETMFDTLETESGFYFKHDEGNKAITAICDLAVEIDRDKLRQILNDKLFEYGVSGFPHIAASLTFEIIKTLKEE